MGFFRVSFSVSFRVSFRVSYQDFFRVLWVSSRVSLGFHLRYKATEHEKQRDSQDRQQRSRGARSRVAETHD